MESLDRAKLKNVSSSFISISNLGQDMSFWRNSDSIG